VEQVGPGEIRPDGRALQLRDRPDEVPLRVVPGQDRGRAAIAGVALTTTVRLLAVRFGWRFPDQHALVVGARSRR